MQDGEERPAWLHCPPKHSALGPQAVWSQPAEKQVHSCAETEPIPTERMARTKREAEIFILVIRSMVNLFLVETLFGKNYVEGRNPKQVLLVLCVRKLTFNSDTNSMFRTTVGLWSIFTVPRPNLFTGSAS